MAGGKGISGYAVGFAAVGGILVYAGFRGTNPVGALRLISTGKPVLNPTPADLGSAGLTVVSAAAGAGVAAAAGPYMGDKYSQAKRTQSGWSDCSSFADKVLSDAGIPPPVKWASTANYRISGDWKTIPISQTKPGDIAVSSHHMVVITTAGGSGAIGQQNSTVNVRTGSVGNLMGSQSYVCKTYIGKGK